MNGSSVDHKELVDGYRQKIVDYYLHYYPNHDLTKILEAIDYAVFLHRGQLRKSGRVYIAHPLEVTLLCAQAGLDESCLIGAMLHDTIEDTVSSRNKIAELFGKDIAELVDALTKIRSYSSVNQEESKQESKRLTYVKLLQAASRNVRPLVIKIFDRLQNMNEMYAMTEKASKRISQETMEVYMPIARRLGMNKVSRELANLSLKYTQPAAYRSVMERIQQFREQNQEQVNQTLEDISRLVGDRFPVKLEHFWPDPCDMLSPVGTISVDMEPFVTVDAVLLDGADTVDLYSALGMLHTTHMYVPESLHDYLASPMGNGYRALETKLNIHDLTYNLIFITPDIQTINAHGVTSNWPDGKVRRREFYQRYVAMLGKIANDGDLRMEDVLSHAELENIIVYSPKKEIYFLPEGATALDFAYLIHSEVGQHASGAVVQGVERPLDWPLESGDVVRIQTNPSVHPTEQWTDWAKTSQAKARIRASLRKQRQARFGEIGRDLMDHELQKYHVIPSEIYASDAFAALLKKEKMTAEELFLRVGQRERLPGDLLNRGRLVQPDRLRQQRLLENLSLRKRLFNVLKTERDDILINDINDVILHYARCCNPLAGDNVVGVIQKDRGIELHTAQCPTLSKVPDRDKVNVVWKIDTRVNNPLLNVHIADNKGVFAHVLKVISDAGINIMEFTGDTLSNEERGSGKEGLLKLRLQVRNLDDLLRVAQQLRRIPDVIGISRED